MANVTAVRFNGDRRTKSRITPDSSSSWRSTRRASNFRLVNRRIDSGSSWQTWGEIDSSLRAWLNCWIITVSADTKSANAVAMMKERRDGLAPYQRLSLDSTVLAYG